MDRNAMSLALAAFVLAACSASPNIQADTAPGVDMSAYSTYQWVTGAPPAGLNPVAYERIRQGVENQLSAKGYKAGNPGDLAVIATIGTREKTDITTYGALARNVDVYQYTEGKLAVDVFDAKTKRPIWHGQATETIDPDKSDPAKLDAAVGELMAQFPGRI